MKIEWGDVCLKEKTKHKPLSRMGGTKCPQLLLIFSNRKDLDVYGREGTNSSMMDPSSSRTLRSFLTSVSLSFLLF